MNPSLKLIFALIISLEITFTTHLTGNLLIIFGALLVLAYHRVSPHKVTKLALITLIPAAALFVTMAFFSPGHNVFFAWVLVSRLYCYVLVGGAVTLTTDKLTLIRSLEQNCHLPSKFAYGFLAALNLVPRIRQAVVTIRVAGQMRGVNLHWWSPTLYFKAILSAIQWSDQLAQAMETHGFVEGAPRTVAQPINITKRDWLLLIAGLALIQLVLIALP
ncbi:energy-coupling factor transporter transmembrane component T family protein [Limosilactobacillus panis]|jgi:energy-coupling factor transport system permease protein|uniref:ABC superfamily ATP binding cassette transporter, permease protein n=1 Tax=Limosilactobacillus panis DSM 6035 TaxID=1423782 RepID=A0A0R1X5M8_9LACO|nr:energy-coupling factor transporter transmembrane component T [Limosilactobacillus panis]KRM25281.1 ABC superfamily ATP binding cassette transporter, permease protein [Limosilactobacillus panis DSM 6035]QZN92865.1 energy-coupling factor transporter transmembrane protein EcfT [Limosilactobacillus panis]